MNVCLLDYNFFVMGGAEKVLTNLANEFSNYFNTSILSICGQNNDKSVFSLNDNIKITSITQDEGRIRDMILKSFTPLRKYFKNEKIDVCLIFGHYPITQIIPVMPFVKTKFIFCDHGALCNQLDDKKATLFRRLASKFCKKTITLTEKSSSDYIKIFKRKSTKISFIYNWIEKELIENSNHNYNVDSKKIMSVGRISSEKGYDMLCDVVKIVSQKHPDWIFDIYGDGQCLSQIKDKIIKLNIQKNMILKGPAKVNELYKQYAMLVLPSYREGLPLVLLEAKANKLPLISFDVNTGPSEIITDQLDGFLIKPYDIEQMADKICCLIENPDIRLEMSSNYKNKLELFSQDTILKQWIELIQTI